MHKLLILKNGRILCSLFWVLLLIDATAAVDYSNGDSRIGYYDIVPRKAMNFPQIYLCPTSYMNSSYLNETKETEERYLNQTWDNRNAANTSSNEGILTEKPEELYKKMMKIGFDEKEIFLACQFRSLFLTPVLCRDIVRPVLDVNYGKCYLIDVGDRKQQVPGQGLMLLIHLKSELFVTSPSMAPLTVGWHLRVGMQIDQGGSESIYVTPGTYTQISLTEEHLIYDNDECVKNNSEIKILSGDYSQSNCIMDCFLQTVHDRCKCILMTDKYFLKPSANFTFCNKNDGIACILPRVTNDLNAAAEIEKCRSKCGPPCEIWRYDTKSTSLPINRYSRPVASRGEDPNNYMYLRVAFSRLETKEYRQHKQP